MKSVFVRVGMAVTFCAAGLAAQPAKAQMMCAPRETVIERLRTGYGLNDREIGTYFGVSPASVRRLRSALCGEDAE